MEDLKFPEGFVWGAATSSHQIEGATEEDGRGESIWDRYAATPGKIEDGSDASVACDHYHRWREDVSLIDWMGLGAYRFSIAWPRILPEGTGAVNQAGLDFYDNLVDRLLEEGIQPYATLYHWDLPQVLQDRGGWAVRETAEAFVAYTHAVAHRLGDRVKNWMTHNEPWCVATLGYEEGHHAPGLKDPGKGLRAAHHVLLSHGLATQVLRQTVEDARVGIVLNLTPAEPASAKPQDLDAARWFDGFFNRWYLDPLFKGEYPADAIEDRRSRGHIPAGELPFRRPGDLATISMPIDFLGVNYYSRVVMHDIDGKPEAKQVVPTGELTDMGWEVYPQGLTNLLVRLNTDYQLPDVYITENGAAYGDGPDERDRIADERRVDYLHRHLAAVHEAIALGVPLRGYFAWSLMDNFEWAHGYARRFGLFYVDYSTLRRLPKDSAQWYRRVVANNQIPFLANDAAMRRL